MLAKCYRNDTVSAAFEDSGAAHSVTTVSIRNLLRRRLWARPDDAAALVGQRVTDAVHPTGFGHWEYAAAIEYAIGQQRGGAAWADAGTPPQADTCRAAWAPLAPRNLFAGTSASSSAVRATVCAFAESLKPYVLRASGFGYSVERNKQGLPKPGYVATTAGAELELCYEPEMPSTAKLERLAGASGVAKVRSAWHLGCLTLTPTPNPPQPDPQPQPSP